jgi:preprotein translocase subunit YajC
MSFSLIMQAAPPSAGGSLVQSLILFGPLILIFYFLILRPQNQRVKKHRALLESIQRNDTVVTNGGLIGKVKKVADDEVTVNFGGTDIKVVKSMIADVRNKTTAANDTAKD